MLLAWSRVWLASVAARLRLPAPSLKPAQLAVAAGVLFVIGFWLHADADGNRSAAEARLFGNDATAWGDVLGFDTDLTTDAAYYQAEADLGAAESEANWGTLCWVFAAGLGIGAIVLRRSRRTGTAPSSTSGVLAAPEHDQADDDSTDAFIRSVEPVVARPKKDKSRRPCPRCGESIKKAATMCRFCQLENPFLP